VSLVFKCNTRLTNLKSYCQASVFPERQTFLLVYQTIQLTGNRTKHG